MATKYFGDRLYAFVETFHYKSSADLTAKELRARGWAARVTKDRAGTYSVYRAPSARMSRDNLNKLFATLDGHNRQAKRSGKARKGE